MVLKMPLAFLGFHPALIAFVAGANLVYQFWIHTEAVDRLPRWFEAVFNTPSHHRVHHARNPRYLDANYAGTLIVWDRLFGTFVAESFPFELLFAEDFDGGAGERIALVFL